MAPSNSLYQHASYEPMNASSSHPKVKLALKFAKPSSPLTAGNGNTPLFVAGGAITGKMEMECKAGDGLGLAVMMVELIAVQELTSRDHSARSPFLHTRRLFQGPGLPPSNAVHPFPPPPKSKSSPNDPSMPPTYHHARRGLSTFLFRIPVPASAPASVSLGNGLASVRYEVRASVGVWWKGERKMVLERREVEVVEEYQEEPLCDGEGGDGEDKEVVVVGEGGKIWMQGKVLGAVLVAGESACVELQVKNHSPKKNSGLTITLSRHLHLPIPSSSSSTAEKPPIQISEQLRTFQFKGPEYVVPPGGEGVASLVFDVPRYVRSVRGGLREHGNSGEGKGGNGGGNELSGKGVDALFEVRVVVGVKMNMGLGSKDITLDIPVTVVHPAALPSLPPDDPYPNLAQMHTGIPMSYTPGPLSHTPAPMFHTPVPMSHTPVPMSHTPIPMSLTPSHTPQPYHSPDLYSQQQAYYSHGAGYAGGGAGQTGAGYAPQPFVDGGQVYFPPPPGTYDAGMGMGLPMPPYGLPGHGHGRGSPVHGHGSPDHSRPISRAGTPQPHAHFDQARAHTPGSQPHTPTSQTPAPHAQSYYLQHPSQVPHQHPSQVQHQHQSQVHPSQVQHHQSQVQYQYQYHDTPPRPTSAGGQSVHMLPLVDASPRGMGQSRGAGGAQPGSPLHPHSHSTEPVTAYHNVPPTTTNISSTSTSNAPPTSNKPDPDLGEEGTGQRASRFTRALHEARRNRSVSPARRRYPVGVGGVGEVVGVVLGSENETMESGAGMMGSGSGTGSAAAVWRDMPPSTSSINAANPINGSGNVQFPPYQAPALSQSQSQQPPPPHPRTHTLSLSIPSSALYSPRPILSPKQSFSAERGVPRSEKVEELERMAERIVEGQEGEGVGMSASGVAVGMKRAVSGDMDKTLPGPPVPSSKPVSVASRPRADEYFKAEAPDHDIGMGTAASSPPPTPLTPTITAIKKRPSPPKVSSTSTAPTSSLEKPSSSKPTTVSPKPTPVTSLLSVGRTESGLDALERRLLQQVGTKKVDGEERRRDVRDILAPGVVSTATPGVVSPATPGVLSPATPGVPSPVLGGVVSPVLSDAGAEVGSGGGSVVFVGSGRHDAASKPKDDHQVVHVPTRPRTKPITIPEPKSPQASDESAISSLTLAGQATADFGGDDEQDQDGLTHRGGKSNKSFGGDGGRITPQPMPEVPPPPASVSGSEGNPRHRKHSHHHHRHHDHDRSSGSGGHKHKKRGSKTESASGGSQQQHLKKAAKGRVAAWLGGVGDADALVKPEVPPSRLTSPAKSPTVDLPPPSPVVPPSPAVGVEEVLGEGALAVVGKDVGEEEEKDIKELLREQDELEASQILASAPSKPSESKPDPRSSGFVPIGTQKHKHLVNPGLTIKLSSVRNGFLIGAGNITAKIAQGKVQPFKASDPSSHARRVADMWAQRTVESEREKKKREEKEKAEKERMEKVRRERASSPAPQAKTPTPVPVKKPTAAPKPVAPTSARLTRPLGTSSGSASPLSVDHPARKVSENGAVSSKVFDVVGDPMEERRKKEAAGKTTAGLLDRTRPRPSLDTPSSTASTPVSASKSTPSSGSKPSSSNAVPTTKPTIAAKPTVGAVPATKPTNAGLAATRPAPPKASSSPAVPRKPLVKRATPPGLIKSASIPALISSSHAKPVISSTASLARPLSSPRSPPPLKVSASIPEEADPPSSKGPARKPNGAGDVTVAMNGVSAARAVFAGAATTTANATSPSPGGASVDAAPKAGLAIGQNRLRELIKKYQG